MHFAETLKVITDNTSTSDKLLESAPTKWLKHLASFTDKQTFNVVVDESHPQRMALRANKSDRT